MKLKSRVKSPKDEDYFKDKYFARIFNSLSKVYFVRKRRGDLCFFLINEKDGENRTENHKEGFRNRALAVRCAKFVRTSCDKNYC